MADPQDRDQSALRRDLHKLILPGCVTGLIALVPWAYNTFSSRPAGGSGPPAAADASVAGQPVPATALSIAKDSPDTSAVAPPAAPAAPAVAPAATPPQKRAVASARERPAAVPRTTEETKPETTLATYVPPPAPRPSATPPPPDRAEAERPGTASGMMAEEEEFRRAMQREEAQFTAEAALEERAFLDEESDQYRRFVAEIQSQWGTFVPSTQPVWSSYTTASHGHGEADFEKGTVNVEVLVDDVPGSRDGAPAQLAEALKAMMSTKNPLNRNPLEDLVDAGGGKPARPEDVTKLVQKTAAKGEVVRRTVKAADGRPRTVASMKVAMVPNRLAQSARPYLTIVKQQAERFGVDPDLVLAVIHTESYFNPFAKSGAPAYGLMQLVPTSGAKEAYAFVHHSAPRTVEPRELYQPEVNVELGTAYLHLLLTHHFNDLKDPLARIYASISAYNCGPRNTMKALVPLGGTAKLLPIGASAKQVYDALRVGTPQETRQYVQLVADRRSLWRQPGP